MSKYSHLNYYGATDIEIDNDVMLELFGEVLSNEENRNDTRNREE